VPSPVKTVALTHLPFGNRQKRCPNANRVADWGRCLCRRCLRANSFQEILNMPQLVALMFMARFCLVPRIQWCLYHGRNGNRYHNDVNGCGDGGNTAESFTPIHLLDNAQDLAQRLAQLADLLVTCWNARKFNQFPKKSLRRPMRH